MSLQGKIRKIVYNPDNTLVYVDLSNHTDTEIRKSYSTAVTCSSLSMPVVELCAGTETQKGYAVLESTTPGRCKANVGDDVIIGACGIRKSMSAAEQLEQKANDLKHNLEELGKSITYQKAYSIVYTSNPTLVQKMRLEEQ